jgi:adenine-specific DNA-methyltransferase
MSKIDITRTELVWPGKYDENGNLVPPRRVSLPFQVIERVNETRASRQQHKVERKGHVATLFDYWQEEKSQSVEPGDDWRNKLIWGDNLYVMGSLLEKYAGKIDLIYIDPPFATGGDFSIVTNIGDGEEEIVKEQSIIEETTYRDTWGKGLDSYLQMIQSRILLLRDLLSETGSIYIHLDWHLGHYVKLLLDDVFGRNYFQNEICWAYRTQGATKKRWSRKHDTIFFYTKTENWVFNHQTERSYMLHKYGFDKDDFKVDEEGRQYRDAIVRDVWEIPAVQSATYENIGFRTQKPEKLLERVIIGSSNKDDLIFDAFCGSGTTMAVAEKLGRRWIGCDLGRYAIHTTRKRLMEIPDCKPFEILNLGQYERQVWQGVTFDGYKQTQQMLIFEYLKFILELYGAQPLAGTQVLHGKKGSAVVHVGAVDAPVTIDEVNSCIEECRKMGQKELHILGWEWEMGLANLMVDEAKGQGIKLLMLTIPREVMEQQAVEKGDIHFYELAYLEPKIITKGKVVTVELSDFVIPNDELIPPEVRQKIKKWSDYVDYWAIDWDFQNDTFINGWTSYRTRKDRTLLLKSEAHEYTEPGKYRVVVKVIDIFGNDTSQVFEVELK